MIERVRIRCPHCRSGVLLTALWAGGDVCPRCSTPLDTVVPPRGSDRRGAEARSLQIRPRSAGPFGLSLGSGEG